MRLKTIITFLVATLIIASSFFGGYLFGHQNLKFEGTLVPKIVNTELGKPREIDFSLFWEAWDLLHQKYIGELDPRALIFGAIRGMVAAVGDPYTIFLSPDESESFLKDLAGQFEGIGAEIAIRNGKLIILSPLDGSPAARAGLKPKDWIAEIDGEPTDTLQLGEATSKIRGKAGTKVVLTIVSEGSREAREVTVIREKIIIESVQVSYRNIADGGEVALVRIVQFGPDTSADMKKKAAEIVGKGVKGVVVDLRNNPGGYLDAAIDVTSLFVNEEIIVQEKRKDGTIKSFKRTLDAQLSAIPLIILLNEGSASASEIMAGAIQDYGRGEIIGEKSFGKGSVQDLEKLKGGSSLRVTVAKWLTPLGREIDQKGITPDIQVVRTDEDVAADRDPQLDRALEELSR